ncbi:MAG: hypothetical protein J6D30_02320 [Clostridia bacterium]|nr:hypothetical protein [Clostridia bacterium]
MRILKRILAFACALGICLTIGGVYAMWYYLVIPEDVSDSFKNLEMTGFLYESKEVLPDNEENQLNAQGLLEYIINNVKIGLNSSKGNILLREIIESDNVLHSKETIQGSNLKHIFEDTASTALEFTLEYISDTHINAYIYADLDLARAEQLHSTGVQTVRIPVYKSIIQRSSANKRDWDDKGTMIGNADTVEEGSFYVIDVSTW